MTKSPQIRMYAEASGESAMPTHQEALALLARADNEIELRVKTPLATTESLERYARDFALAADQVLVGLRQADWYKPYVILDNPYGILNNRAAIWHDKREHERIVNPRIRITDPDVAHWMATAEAEFWRKRHGEPRPKRPGQLRAIYESRLVNIAEVFWAMRELAGVSEITLLPSPRHDADAYPITATFATGEGLDQIRRSLILFAEGKRAIAIVRQVTEDVAHEHGVSERSSIWTHVDRRVDLYRGTWEKIYMQRGYGDNPREKMRPCICRNEYPQPRNKAEATEQWARSLFDREPHKPECFQRLIDIVTYAPDWWLGINGFADQVGQRESLIAYNKKFLKIALRVGEA